MLSLRGLRGTILSTSPRHAFSHQPSRSFTSSFIWCSTRHLPEASGAGQSVVVGHDDHRRANTASGGLTGYKLTKTANATLEDVDDGKRTSNAPDVRMNMKSTPEELTESEKRAQELGDSVKAVMAKLPHPAVVITTLDRTYEAQAAAGVPIGQMRHPVARGITASSLTSLCIHPKPHVMFNMTLPSTMYDALVACRGFNVHVLTPDEFGARVASVFTRGNRLPSAGQRKSPWYAFDIDADLGVFVGLKDEGFDHVEIANRDAWHEQYQHAKESDRRKASGLSQGQDYEPGARKKQLHCAPCLHSRGIMEVLNCRLVRSIHPESPGAGNNVIIIGEVVDVTFPRRPNKGPGQTPVALGYADRKYRSVGGIIDPLRRAT
ncbi:flavin reductase like domain-containing protein [Xylaria sp. CBS 124048]|nr:flavin reductase like domain-containing protein [Xylaria sp. CBS 124048]